MWPFPGFLTHTGHLEFPMLQRVSRSREKSGFESSNASRVLVKELKKRQNELKELKESKSEISDLSIELDDAFDEGLVAGEAKSKRQSTSCSPSAAVPASE